jgi:hypothetical protein
MANELATKFAQRAAASPLCKKRYRHVWTQEQSGVTYGDGVDYWAAVYEISTSISSPALTVNVLINATDGGGGFTAEVMKRWEQAIKRVWSDKATVPVACCSSLAGTTPTPSTRSRASRHRAWPA